MLRVASRGCVTRLPPAVTDSVANMRQIMRNVQQSVQLEMSRQDE